MSSCASREHVMHGHKGRAPTKSSSIGSLPIFDVSESIGTPTTQIGPQTPTVEENVLSQAMLLVLE